jgi:hypothetical protein
MQLDNLGELTVQTKLIVPEINLNNNDLQATLDSKANLNNPTFTGTASGITKTMVGLGNVDNTSDASKAVSTATQTALNLKANLINPTFTSDITLSTTGANEIIFNTNASTPNYNYIGYDATNNLNILCNNQTIITSSSTTT